MKLFRKLFGFLGTLVVVAIVALAVLLVGVRAIGLTPYTVLSGSMEPTYHVGSLIYVKEVDPADVQIGDPITFVVNEDLLVATHRVVDIEVITERTETVTDEATGETTEQVILLEEPVYYYQTKGDANDSVDGAPVHHMNLIGSPVFTVPYLGYLSSWLQTREGMIMGVSIALVMIILMFLPDMLRSADEADKRAKRGKHAR